MFIIKLMGSVAGMPIVAANRMLDAVIPYIDNSRHTFDSAAQLATAVVEEGQDLVEDAMGTHRRVWMGEDGHAQIEVRGIDKPQHQGLRNHLKEALERLDAVKWVEVNSLTRRVAVAMDASTPVEKLVSVVEAVEAANGIHARLEEPQWEIDNPADHPSDEEPIHRAIAAIVGNGLALGISVVSKLSGRVIFMNRLGSVITLIDLVPPARRFVEDQIGRPARQLLFPLLSALGNGLGQGTSGLVTDMVYQYSQLTEAQARKDVWERREPELYSYQKSSDIAPPRIGPRPVDFPDGPVEVWIKRSGQISLSAAVATLMYTWSFSATADILFAGVPKATEYGRKGFAAQLGRILAARGVVPLDALALRRLDRINTVVLDSETLLTNRLLIEEVLPVEGISREDAGDSARQALSTMMRKHRVLQHTGSNGEQQVQLLDYNAGKESLPEALKAELAGLEQRGLDPYILQDKQYTLALVGIASEIDPLAQVVIDAIREADMRFMIAGTNGHLDKRLGHDGAIPAGRDMGLAVRKLQGEGAGVAVVARSGTNGLAAADLGINIAKPSGRPSWGGDLLCGPDLEEVVLVIKACAVAREVSTRSVQFAASGSALGMVSALMANRQGTPSHALTMVNAAALSALAYGTWKGIELGRAPKAVSFDTTPWHELPVEEVLEYLESNTNGITANQARYRLRATRSEQTKVNALEPFIAELANPLNPVLAVGSALSLLTDSRLDAALVASFIGINTLIGGYQRMHTERTLNEMLSKTEGSARVLRAGKEMELPEAKLVTGDIVRLSVDETVPADCRIIEANNLEVDESNITGEALPVAKNAEPCWEEELTERTNMLYEDSTIVAGEATAVVVATGIKTHVSRTMAESQPEMMVTGGGVEMRLRELTQKVIPVSAAAAATSVAAGLLHPWSARDILSTCVSIAIASVPEGLPFIATSAQLAAVRRLARRNAIVRNPRKIEVLGRVNVLCFDKTGTLTEGRVKLERIGDARSHRSFGELARHDYEVLAHGLRATASNENEPEDLMDRTIIKACEEVGINKQWSFDKWDSIEEIPFEASRGLHTVLAETEKGRLLSVKGAPETVLEKCTTMKTAEGSEELTPANRQQALRTMHSLMEKGHRILAVACGNLKPDEQLEHGAYENLQLLGFLGFSDPILPTAVEAAQNIRKAGVEVVMITGDHAQTAEGIARSLDILKPREAHQQNGSERRILTGSELKELTDEQLDEVVNDIAVYARVTPRQKVRVVKSLQRRGKVVAMTGDGANDAPAIRLADIGVAMGARGTAAAREAADLVVTDDRLETIVDALSEGRALWGSVREAIGIVVGGNLGEVSFTGITSIFSRKPPMNARQFLLVNLMTDLLPAIAIAVRPPVDKTPEMLLKEGPEVSLGAALSNKITLRAVATTAGATTAWTLARFTGTASRASTVGLLGLVGSQLGQTVVAGGYRSPLVVASAGGSALALFAIVQTPGVSHFFGCRPVGPVGWSIAAGSSAMATVGSAIAAKFMNGNGNGEW